ncbi:transposase [Streptomyces sp. 900116325]
MVPRPAGPPLRQGLAARPLVADAGYDAPRLAFLREDLPVQVSARMRSDRVLRRAVPSRQPHTRVRPPRHRPARPATARAADPPSHVRRSSRNDS